jgi:hypothetical protein
MWITTKKFLHRNKMVSEKVREGNEECEVFLKRVLGAGFAISSFAAFAPFARHSSEFVIARPRARS